MPIIVDPDYASGTELDLVSIFFNAASNLADLRAFRYAGDSLAENTTARGEVRQLANRRRLITRGSDVPAESFSLTLPHCTREDVAWLRAHVSQLLCVRDHVGTKFYGAYLEVPRQVSTTFRDWTSVQLSLDEVTYSEAV